MAVRQVVAGGATDGAGLARLEGGCQNLGHALFPQGLKLLLLAVEFLLDGLGLLAGIFHHLLLSDDFFLQGKLFSGIGEARLALQFLAGQEALLLEQGVHVLDGYLLQLAQCHLQLNLSRRQGLLLPLELGEFVRGGHLPLGETMELSLCLQATGQLLLQQQVLAVAFPQLLDGWLLLLQPILLHLQLLQGGGGSVLLELGCGEVPEGLLVGLNLCVDRRSPFCQADVLTLPLYRVFTADVELQL